MFSPTVSRRHAAVSRTNAPHQRDVDAPRHACTTPVSFEKAHETRCFLRNRWWQVRTIRNAATHVVYFSGMSAKVYGDCRSASDGTGISGSAQARLRKTAQAPRPSRHPAANSPNRPSTIAMVADASTARRVETHALACGERSPRAPRRKPGAPSKTRMRNRVMPTAMQACIAAHSFARNHSRGIGAGCDRIPKHAVRRHHGTTARKPDCTAAPTVTS